MINFATSARLLSQNGYTPIPVVAGGKYPTIKNWTNINYEQSPQLLGEYCTKYPNASTGILLGDVCAVDIDVLDEQAAKACSDIVVSKFGEVPCRIGKAPKSAYFFRVEGNSFSKFRTAEFKIDGDKAQVEFLCDGQQVVVFGEHPHTKKPYSWCDKSLLDVNISQLPTISESEAQGLKDKFEKQLGCRGKKTPESRDSKAPLPNSLNAIPSMKVMEEALSFIDPQVYDDWIAIGHALKTIGAPGLKLFLSWSKRRPDGSVPRNFVSDDDVRKRWNSFKPVRTSLAAVLRKAAESGWKGETPFALKSNSHTELARYILADFKLREPCPVFVNGELWRFKDTNWSKVENYEQRLWVQELDEARYGRRERIRANKSLIDGVLSELHAMCEVPGFFDEPALGINCLSGFIKLSPNQQPVLVKHSPEQRQRFCINASWPTKIKKTPASLTERFFNGISGQGKVAQAKRSLLEEILGASCASLGTWVKIPKAFVLHGSSAQNGKSEYIKLVRGLLPVGAHCAIAPSDMAKEQFLANLSGKTANLTSELSSTRAIASDKVKAVISGDVVAAKRVYQPVFQFKPNALHVFATNILPTFYDGVDEGIRRRFIVIPFEDKIAEDKIVADIAAKILQTEMEMILSLAVGGAARIVSKGLYSLPEWIIRETEAWFADADTLRSWLEDDKIGRILEHQGGISYGDLFKRFREEITDIDPREYVPRFPVFKRVVREYVKQNPELEIVRRSAGYRIIKRVLL
ncbi:MAG: hypothetical protein CMM75_00520 [Rhodospirillaceae bacterium]|nr:hypothetical protein [Rhodospirillaceae bacterium]